MMQAKKLALLSMLLCMSACAHHWPEEARGGMAERDQSEDVAIQEAADTIGYMKATPGLHSPAELVEAEIDIIRAKRERAGGLNNDADASYLDALITLGGSPASDDNTTGLPQTTLQYGELK